MAFDAADKNNFYFLTSKRWKIGWLEVINFSRSKTIWFSMLKEIVTALRISFRAKIKKTKKEEHFSFYFSTLFFAFCRFHQKSSREQERCFATPSYQGRPTWSETESTTLKHTGMRRKALAVFCENKRKVLMLRLYSRMCFKDNAV